MRKKESNDNNIKKIKTVTLIKKLQSLYLSKIE